MLDATGGLSTTPTPPALPEPPPLLHLDEGGIPQGQGYDGASTLLTTYTFESSSTTSGHGEVRLSIQDLNTGLETAYVTLGDADGNVGDAAPGKGGGVAIDGQNVYVADTESVYVYTMADLQDAASRGAVAEASQVVQIPEEHGRASYLQVHEGKLYVGQFIATQEAASAEVEVEGFGERVGDAFDSLNPFQDPVERAGDIIDNISPVEVDVDVAVPQMAVYDLDTFLAGDTAPEPLQTFDIPYDTQGVAVTPNGLLFTRSYGSLETGNPVLDAVIGSPRELVFQAFDGSSEGVESPGDAQRAATIDYYAEGVNVVGNEVWITYESNADKYAGKYEDNTGRAPENTSVQAIALDELDIAPEALGLDPDAG